MLSRCLLVLTALLCCVNDISASTYTIFVNDKQIQNSNGFLEVGGLPSINVTCRLGRVDPQATIILERIINGHTSTLTSYTTSFSSSYTLWTYRLSDTEMRIPVSTYRCRSPANVNCPDYVQVTLYSTPQRPPPGPTIFGCPPGGSSTLPPSSNPTTRPSSGGGTSSPRFTGLNPLIYTISAVILLGTLAIVAIITCWIRARRSYNRRMFQATTNPQDYLDYISDNEFTPLTTSEFVASLQERPPTYHESEEIEGQMRPDGSGEGSSGSRTQSTQESSGNGEASEGGERTGTQSTSSATRVPPPRPPPPSTAGSPQQSTLQLSSSTTSGGDHRSTTERGTEAGATHSTVSESLPDVSEDRTATSADVHDGEGSTLHDSQPLSSTVTASGDVSEITEDHAVTGFGVSSNEPALSGVDALLSLDMDMEIGNGMQLESQSQFHPFSPPSSESTAAVGMLIDLDSGSTNEQVASSSQSAFPRFLPEPTPEQISEIEAAIGAINEHMTQIRKRTE